MQQDYRVFSAGPEERMAAYYRRMVEPRPLRAASKQQWLDRRSDVRRRTLSALGLAPMPDRLPLDPRTGGVLEREGYRVERLYWQTWPSVWASGWLYLPTGAPGRAAAVLNPHGHWENGARHPVVQSRLIALAKLGYVALAVDSVHLYDYPVGVTPLTVMTYNGIRALDYLQSRSDVDRDRIGITGASGGAQQAMYLLAVEDRIRAGVLAVLVSYFERILMPEGHHCPCNHVPGMMRFTDEPELCGIPSPRALLYLTVTGDWTAPFAAQELRELRALYHLWQQPDRLAHQGFEGPHDYSREMREAAYTWFERELRGNSTAEPVPEPPLAVETPEALAALDRPPAEDHGPPGILAWFYRRTVAQPPQLESRQSRRAYQDRVRTELVELLGGEPESVAQQPIREGTTPDGGVLLSFRTEADVRIPAVWLPRQGEGPRPAAVVLHPDGKAPALRSPAAAALRQAGFGLLAPDVRLRGEMRRDWFHNSVIWGRPEAGMAVQDARACVDWLLGEEGVDGQEIVLAGEGDMGLVALLASGLDERVTATVADCLGTTYRDGGEGLPVIPNLLRTADVPQIASLVAPRPLFLYRVPAERVGFASRRYYDWTRRTYQSLGEPEALKMSTAEAPDPLHLVEWLEKRIRRARR